MAVRQQPAGADGLVAVERQGVKAARVHLVHLELGRHALLVDEHREADALRFVLRRAPRHELDSRHVAKSIIWTQPSTSRPMKSLWSDAEAASFAGPLGPRVYTSRLLGRDRSLVLHG